MKGIDIVADAVRVTMGPKGKLVLLLKAVPIFTLDGVTVAQDIDSLKDPVEDAGAQLVKNVAGITNDEAGDGTTTATILLRELAREGLRGIEQGIDALVLRETYTKAMGIVLKYMKEHTTPVTTKAQMKAIATISSRDPEVGRIISEIYNKIGKDGVITTEETKQVGIDYEVVEGMEVGSGWMSPYFQTNEDRGFAEVNKPYIIVTSQLLRNNKEIAPVMNEIMQKENKSVVFFVDNAQGEAFATIILNKLKGYMDTLVVKAPDFGDSKTESMKDICAITGAEFITEELGKNIEDATIEQLGRADRVIAYKDRTVIVGGKGNKKAIQKRIAMLERELKDTTSRYKIDNLTHRLAKLKGGVAVIRVGDITEEASRERQFRIEDAINATKSGIEEGVVVGGGLALYNASLVLDKMREEEKDPDIRFGYQAVSKAIKRPVYQILENQGLNAEVVLSKGYKLGKEVIDPFKVERVALEQSISVAGLFLVTEALIYTEPETKEEPKKLE